MIGPIYYTGLTQLRETMIASLKYEIACLGFVNVKTRMAGYRALENIFQVQIDEKP
jgi:hypothetical protein